MDASEIYADDHHWGSRPIDISARDLPALKTRYLIDALPGAGRVLEVGCGGGRILKTIARYRPELELHGCDIRALGYSPKEFAFTLSDPHSSRVPYEDGSFDAVVMSDILEHLVDPGAILNAVRSVLRPGGVLVSFVPLEGQAFSFFRMYRRVLGDQLYAETKEHIQAFSEQSLCDLIQPDFAIVDRTYIYHLLGHLMDATLFALVKLPSIRKRFWEENPYYEESDAPAGESTSLLSHLLQVGNVVAYEESRMLRRVRWGSAGLLLTAHVR